MSEAAHLWKPMSRHQTSEGWVLYEHCACGSIRIVLNGEAVTEVASAVTRIGAPREQIDRPA